MALASAALANTQIAVAERAFAHLVSIWPDHAEAAEARNDLASLREMMLTEFRHRGLAEELGFRVYLLHYEINRHLNQGHYEKVCDAANRLLTICPTFTPALNNRCEAHFRAGRYAEAIAASRRMLELEPTNYHALANLPRHLYLSGRFANPPRCGIRCGKLAEDEG